VSFSSSVFLSRKAFFWGDLQTWRSVFGFSSVSSRTSFCVTVNYPFPFPGGVPLSFLSFNGEEGSACSIPMTGKPPPFSNSLMFFESILSVFLGNLLVRCFLVPFRDSSFGSRFRPPSPTAELSFLFPRNFSPPGQAWKEVQFQGRSTVFLSSPCQEVFPKFFS